MRIFIAAALTMGVLAAAAAAQVAEPAPKAGKDGSAGKAAAQTNGAAQTSAEKWRFQFHGDQWYYFQTDNRWVVWKENRWQPAEIAADAMQELAGRLQADRNKQEGEAFLEANKKQAGVVTRDSGLQYKVLKRGNGPTPATTDQVTVNYKGTLIDGKQFDSSYDRGQPITLGVSNVILGWTEALQLMKVGDKWQLFVPSKLAYGERGAGAAIGPNAALIFEVELLGVTPAQ